MPKKKADKLDKIIEKLLEHDTRFDSYDKRFDNIDNRFGEVATTLDKIMGEIEKSREDRVFASAKDKEQDKHFDNLFKRLDALEASRS